MSTNFAATVSSSSADSITHGPAIIVAFMFFSLVFFTLQGQGKPSAESLFYAEAKPVLAISIAKVSILFETCKK
jgi:hypothetical protein